MTSRSIALPPRFKCAVGGEWKTNSEFSQNQLKRWSQKKRHDNDGITSVNIGLVCKVHSGAPQNTTIKCEGPCGQMKVRDAFSKNQRNRPDAWCKRCTEWKERQQPDEIPTAPPNANMSHDEVYLDTSQAVDNDDLNLNVVQDDSDDDVHNSSSGDDDEDDGPSVLRSTLRSLHQSSRGKYHDDDNGNGDHDDRADDTRV
ncbi:hypothetical protein UCREL1_11267 [Eutypa lata UCREL1]|uniref:Stc1 domain-containing protein n=1 Tax=Eutypa lata (strain UCR-EL1) TaxID=1287681 RepID=M7SW44_EUTLA|nr:hypothetical protein UCREL1_11267 [Eutypa lata UCREL1]